MRLKRSRLRQCFHKKRTTEKNNEGGIYNVYGSPSSFLAEVWPASGKVQAEMYGERLKYIQNVRINEVFTTKTDDKGLVHYILPSGADIVESDGICLFVGSGNDPDYKIVAIKPYRFLKLEVEHV